MKRRSLFKSILGLLAFPAIAKPNHLSCKEIDDAFSVYDDSNNLFRETYVKLVERKRNAYYGKINPELVNCSFGKTIKRNSFK